MVLVTALFLVPTPAASISLAVDILTHATPAASDGFGYYSAAAGDFLAVGAIFDDVSPFGDVGTVHVFNVPSGTLRFTLANPAPASSDRFGEGLAATADFLAVGAPFNNVGAVGDAGSVYVFNPATGALLWTFDNPSPAASDWFGMAVAVFGDRLLVGVRLDDPGIFDAGTAYLYDLTTGALLATLANPAPQSSDQFGTSVAFVDANTLAVGAAADNPSGVGDAGSVYLFNAAGALQRTINAPTLASFDVFGHTLAAYDGDLFISAPGRAVGGNQDAGAVYRHDPATGALLTTYVEPASAGPMPFDNLGRTLAPGPMGLLVGTWTDDDPTLTNVGEAWLFDIASGTATWQLLEDGVRQGSDEFGWGVSQLGNLLFVGAPLDNVPATDAGRVFVYDALDFDADTVQNTVDNCVHVSNADQADLDGDAIGNVCDADRDGDLLSNTDETTLYGTNPDDADSDGEGLTDGEEVLAHGTDPLDADTDEEGLSDYDEVAVHGTDPLDPDSDDDGLTDRIEIFLFATDPLAADTDGDAIDDATELALGLDPLDGDTDGDGATDGDELAAGTDPLDADTDDDGLIDGAEAAAGTDPFDSDSDDDGLLDGPEVGAGTDPLDADTDDDGLVDGDEAFVLGTDPLVVDTDGDGLGDGDEVLLYGTNPLDTDTDADGVDDAAELVLGTDPLNADTDGDLVSDGDELLLGTDPLDADSDDDGADDGLELAAGTDPLNPDSDGDGLDDTESADFGTDALDNDTDDDGLGDGEEVNGYGTDPLDRDTDGDLFGDATEVAGGSDPTNPTSVPTAAGPVPGLAETDGTELDLTDGIEPVA